LPSYTLSEAVNEPVTLRWFTTCVRVPVLPGKELLPL
jgi:hypothetical protein